MIFDAAFELAAERNLQVSCTYIGAKSPQKKTLNFPQNLENKGSEFFLPARTMVLKVVTGKIFQTLELCGSSSPPSVFILGQEEWAGRRVSPCPD